MQILLQICYRVVGHETVAKFAKPNVRNIAENGHKDLALLSATIGWEAVVEKPCSRRRIYPES